MAGLARIARRAAPLLIAVLAACAPSAPAPVFAELTYSHLGSIALAASRIDVVDGYRSPLRTPNVEHRMPTPPAVAARRWADDRLTAVGRGGRRAVFTIEVASVVETALPRKGGLGGLFRTDQAERYDAELAVRLQIFDVTGHEIGVVTARAVRSRTVPEGATLNERDQAWFEITEKLMADLNGALEQNIASHLPPPRR